MAEGFTRKFNFEDSLDDDSGIGMKSGTNSIELDSEARSVRSWESESERDWENESDDEDEDALGIVIMFDQITVFYQCNLAGYNSNPKVILFLRIYRRIRRLDE